MDHPDYSQMAEKEVLAELSTDKKKGLDDSEVLKRIEKHGRNTIKIESKISALKILIEQFTNFLVIILIIAAIISYIFTRNDPEGAIDTFLIIGIVIFNAIFGFIQDYKAEKSIEALKNMAVTKAIVLRNGCAKEINAEDVVIGDIIFLEEGKKVPADIRILEAIELSIDESILTGESNSRSKLPDVIRKETPLADRKNMAYMNTIITRGKGTGIVTATGMDTEVGKIAKEISDTGEKESLFDTELEKLGKKIGFIVLALIIIISIVELLKDTTSIINILMIAVSLGVAAIPEGLPAVVTLSMAIGTRKMLKEHALVRRLSVVEGLGSVDVICTDKTGTLTENMMTVRQIYYNNNVYEVSGTGYNEPGDFYLNGKKISGNELKPLLEIGLFCNDAFFGEGDNKEQKYLGDPTEIALVVSAKKGGVEHKQERVAEIPFSSLSKMMVTANKHDGKIKAYLKGAPEEVIKRCSHIFEGGKIKIFSPTDKKEILEANSEMAKKALRVLGFAYKDIDAPSKANFADDYIFSGLQGMIDPPRKEVGNAIKACLDAGITVKMITGDNLKTAKAIANEVGINGSAIEGCELDELSFEKLKKVVEETNIFARVAPKHKVLILKTLKENGHKVAMTGDGVNDAPALKNADVAVSMGIRGSDLAKEVSDMVLLDDNFITIENSVKEGRTIFSNIRKFVYFLLSCNIAEVLSVFFLSLFGYIPLAAVQLLWINLLTDGFPALALGVDPSADNIMKKKPLKKGEGIINKDLVRDFVFVGFILSILTCTLFFIGLQESKEIAVTMIFTGFVFYEMLQIGLIRMKEKTSIFNNLWLVLAILLTLILQLAVIYTPLNKYFNTVPLGLMHWVWIIAVGLVGAILILGLGKVLRKEKESFA